MEFFKYFLTLIADKVSNKVKIRPQRGRHWFNPWKGMKMPLTPKGEKVELPYD